MNQQLASDREVESGPNLASDSHLEYEVLSCRPTETFPVATGFLPAFKCVEEGSLPRVEERWLPWRPGRLRVWHAATRREPHQIPVREKPRLFVLRPCAASRLRPLWLLLFSGTQPRLSFPLRIALLEHAMDMGMML